VVLQTYCKRNVIILELILTNELIKIEVNTFIVTGLDMVVVLPVVHTMHKFWMAIQNSLFLLTVKINLFRQLFISSVEIWFQYY
jgi:hypothetical protein